MPSSKTTDEPKLTLPSGHPQAGYVEPDLSFSEGAGTLPDEHKKWAEDRDAAQKAQADAVAEHEHQIATEEAAAALEEQEPEPAPKTSTKSTSSSSSST